MDDGERATWPQLPLIRSLCEIEFCLDEVAADLQRSLATSRLAQRNGEAPPRSPSLLHECSAGSTAQARGKLPSYVNLAAYQGQLPYLDDADGGTPPPTPHNPGAPVNGFPTRSASAAGAPTAFAAGAVSGLPYPVDGEGHKRVPSANHMAGVSSFASLLNLAGVDDAGAECLPAPPSVGLAPPNAI